MGAMQLFAACQKAPSVRRVVLKSTSEVYGSSAHDPVMFTEDGSSRRPFRDGFAKDSLDIEGYARGLGRRRPDIAVTILRLANMIGPAMDTTLSRYLAGPVVPTMFGRDARLQLLHEQDALGALERAAMAGKAGTFNIGADGIMMLSQAIRRAGRIPMPVPGFGVFALDSLRRANRYTEITRDQFNYLSYGRVMDTSRMRAELGYQPKWTTAEAFDDYVRGRGLTPIIDPHRVRSLEGRAIAIAQRWGSRNPIPWVGVDSVRYNVAGETRANVIPLHTNRGRVAARRRAAQRAEDSGQHPSLLSDPRACVGRTGRRRRPRDRRAPPRRGCGRHAGDSRGATQRTRRARRRRVRIPPQAADRRLQR